MPESTLLKSGLSVSLTKFIQKIFVGCKILTNNPSYGAFQIMMSVSYSISISFLQVASKINDGPGDKPVE